MSGAHRNEDCSWSIEHHPDLLRPVCVTLKQQGLCKLRCYFQRLVHLFGKLFRFSGGPAINQLAKILFNIRQAVNRGVQEGDLLRSEEHTSELKSLMRISYAVF